MRKGLVLGLISSVILFATHAVASDQGDYYVRVDAGYGMTKIKNTAQSTGTVELNTRATGFVGSLGFGYYLSDYIRVELQGYYENGLKAKTNNIITQSRKKTMAGFVNFGCDMLPSSPVTPYIIGGVGYAQNRFDLTKTDPTTGTPSTYRMTKKGKRGVVWQGGIGLAYSLADNLALDVGYRVINSVNAKKKTCANPSNTDFETCQAKITQAVLGGMRYQF